MHGHVFHIHQPIYFNLPTYMTAYQLSMQNRMGYCAEQDHPHSVGLGNWQKQDHKQAQLNAAGYRLRYIFCI